MCIVALAGYRCVDSKQGLMEGSCGVCVGVPQKHTAT